jgi:hypothetical protein
MWNTTHAAPWSDPYDERDKLLDYLLDITAWSELEAQAFRYTRIKNLLTMCM